MRQKVLVTGSRGYLASLVSLYNQDTFEFVGVSRKDVDYSNPAEVKAFFSAQEFDLLFHTAANATTADCENDPEGTGLAHGAHLGHRHCPGVPRQGQASGVHLYRAAVQRPH